MSPDSVTGKERERVKRVVYAVIYGVGKEKLAELIQSTPSSAQELVKSFLRKHAFMYIHYTYCIFIHTYIMYIHTLYILYIHAYINTVFYL